MKIIIDNGAMVDVNRVITADEANQFSTGGSAQTYYVTESLEKAFDSIKMSALAGEFAAHVFNIHKQASFQSNLKVKSFFESLGFKITEFEDSTSPLSSNRVRWVISWGKEDTL